jgi:hypothetical protein
MFDEKEILNVVISLFILTFTIYPATKDLFNSFLLGYIGAFGMASVIIITILKAIKDEKKKDLYKLLKEERI